MRVSLAIASMTASMLVKVHLAREAVHDSEIGGATTKAPPAVFDEIALADVNERLRDLPDHLNPVTQDAKQHGLVPTVLTTVLSNPYYTGKVPPGIGELMMIEATNHAQNGDIVYPLFQGAAIKKFYDDASGRPVCGNLYVVTCPPGYMPVQLRLSNTSKSTTTTTTTTTTNGDRTKQKTRGENESSSDSGYSSENNESSNRHSNAKPTPQASDNRIRQSALADDKANSDSEGSESKSKSNKSRSKSEKKSSKGKDGSGLIGSVINGMSGGFI